MSEKFPTDDEINCVAEDVALFAQRSDGWVNASYRLAVRMPAICDAARDRNRLERENASLKKRLA